MKNTILYLLLLAPICLFAQMGIGTLHPTAQLEVETEPTGRAALGLQPQENPLGTATGQLAVIGGKLFLFDNDRGKWLSVEQTVLEYGRLGNGSAPAEIEFGGGDLQNGPILPFDGTITSVSISATDDPNNRDITLFINGVAVPNNNIDTTIDGVFNLNPSTLLLNDTNYNLDFNAGDELSLQIDNSVNDVDDLIVSLVVKWRVDNP